MKENLKFIEEEVGSVEFQPMKPGVEYVVMPQPFRGRRVTFGPAPEYELVRVDFLPDEEGLKLADLRELPLGRAGLKEDDLADYLLEHGVTPLRSLDILKPESIPKKPPKEIEELNPSDPRNLIKDYYEEGDRKLRRSRTGS